MRWVVLATLCSLALVGCNDSQCACTLEFEAIRLTVLSPEGLPQPGVEVRTVLERTGAVLSVLEPGSSTGVYSVLDDSSVNKLSIQGEKLRVTGTKDGLSFTTEFVARPDGSCRCHIEKMSGPAAVTLQ